MWLPVVKHVAKATPGGVVGRHKRGATELKAHRKTECCRPDILSLFSILLSLVLLLLGPRSERSRIFNYTHSSINKTHLTITQGWISILFFYFKYH